MAWKEDSFYFDKTAELARRALARGDDGFAAVLVGENGEIMMEQGNMAGTDRDPTAHDAILLARRAAKTYPKNELQKCTMYALVEPCVMCMGAVFWTGIGAVKFAMSEKRLGEILPGGLDISSEEFARRSPSPIRVEGPYPEYKPAESIVKDWVRSLNIPGLVVDD
ncbi:MAG: nucleoside deaminase [Bacillota bacterium]